jgi:hypothetical protein
VNARVVDTKAITVSFPSGRDVLRAYWGLLANGGLVIPNGHGLSVGESVHLTVTIESSRQNYRLRGQVVRRPEIPAAPERAVIEFHPGEPHDLLLSAAWAETDNVPARKHRRMPVNTEVTVRVDGRVLRGRMLNLSLGGCCVTAPGARGIAPGAQAELSADGDAVVGDAATFVRRYV